MMSFSNQEQGCLSIIIPSKVFIFLLIQSEHILLGLFLYYFFVVTIYVIIPTIISSKWV